MSIIDATGFPTDRVQFEVAESILLRDIETARRQIGALQSHGVRVALDDFGTGYSSLSYLASIPFNKLKIDRSFVNRMETMTIIRHIVSLAHQLNMRITAEGVETEYQERTLRLAGCDSFQGYRFGRPGSAAVKAKANNLRNRPLLQHAS